MKVYMIHVFYVLEERRKNEQTQKGESEQYEISVIL
jgi:hypothetical protein